MSSPNDSVFVSRELAEAARDMADAWRRGTLTKSQSPAPVRGSSLMPSIRGILLEDLGSDSTADCATTILVKDSTVQEVEILGLATGGTFSLTFKSKTTTDLAYNVAPADMQAALEKLETIGVGNVVVSLGSGPYVNADTGLAVNAAPGEWIVTFTGSQFAGKTPDLLTVNSSLTGGVSTSVVARSNWIDTGKVVTVRAVIPVGSPTPMRAGAVVVAISFPGQCYGVIAVEPRQFGPGYY
jgi:hypothetical protein